MDADRVVADADRVADRCGLRAVDPLDRVVAACSRPRPAAGRARSPCASLPIGIVAVALRASGSLCSRWSWSPSASTTHSVPLPAAIWSGSLPTSTGSPTTASRSASMRCSVPSLACVTNTSRPSAVIAVGAVADRDRRDDLRAGRPASPVGVGVAVARGSRGVGLVAAAEHAGRAERGGAERQHEHAGERDEQRDAAAARPAGRAGGASRGEARRRRGRGRRRRRAAAGPASAVAPAPACPPATGPARRRRRWRRCRPARARARPAAPPRRRARGRRPTRSDRPASLAMAVPMTASSAGGTPGASALAAGAGSFEVRVHLRQLGVARERRPAGERVEQHGAERVHVGARVGVLAADLLGRGEVGRADEHAGAGEAGGRGRVLGQPEVGQVDVLLALVRRSARSAA